MHVPWPNLIPFDHLPISVNITYTNEKVSLNKEKITFHGSVIAVILVSKLFTFEDVLKLLLCRTVLTYLV